MPPTCRSNLPTQEAVTVFLVDHKNFCETLVPLHQINVSTTAGEVRLNSSGVDPHLETVLLDLDPSFLHVLRIHIRVPQDTVTQIFYQRKHQELYTEADSDSIECYKGKNLITILLPDADSITRIRLDPGTLAGEYILKEFSIFQERQLAIHPTFTVGRQPLLFRLWGKIGAFAQKAYETAGDPWSLFYWILFLFCIVRHKVLVITGRAPVIGHGGETRVVRDNLDKR